MIKNVSYMARGLSDHSPVTLSIDLRESHRPGEWKISPFSMELIGKPDEVLIAFRRICRSKWRYRLGDGVGYLEGLPSGHNHASVQ